MNLKFLTNQQLNQNMLDLASQERALLAEVLMCIKEIDRRKLYASMAYGSLFDYLTKHCGYSPGSAQRRIDAARLMNDVPDVAEKIEAGELTLSQVSHVQKAIRQLKKESRVITKTEKQELIQKLTGLSESESQYRVAEALNLKIKEATKTHHQANKSVRLEITLSEEQWNLLKQAKEVLSHQIPDGNLSEVIAKMSEFTIKQKRTATAIPAERQNTRNNPQEPSKEATQSNTPTKINKTLTPKTKQIIFNRDKYCNYVDPKTKQQCQSQWQLEIDHIQPRWANGSHAQNNLQVLCRTHNQFKYKQQSRIT